MVLFEFDDIIKKKYKYYEKKKPEKITNISFNEFKNIGIQQLSNIFYLYFSDISENYINNIIFNDKTHIILSSIDGDFSIDNIMSILVYHKTKSLGSVKYYVLLLGTHKKFRKLGYGKVILNEFIDTIKSNDKQTNKKILLKSLESSMEFYLSFGFVQTNLKPNKLFYKYEPVSELLENSEKILEYNI